MIVAQVGNRAKPGVIHHVSAGVIEDPLEHRGRH